MPSAPRDLNTLARDLLLLEGGDERAPLPPDVALEGAFGKLMDQLAQLVGARGAAALAGRALRQARQDFPFLEGIVPDPDGATRLQGLEGALDRADPDEARAAAAAALAALLQLLVELLGRNLGLRPVRELWPAAVPETEPDSNEADL